MRFKCNSYSHACGDWPCGVADSPSRVLCAPAARGELRGALRRVRVSAPRFPPCAWDGRRLAPRTRSRRSCRCHTDGPWGQAGTRPCPARGWRCLSAEPLTLWGPACHPQSTPHLRRTAQVRGDRGFLQVTAEREAGHAHVPAQGRRVPRALSTERTERWGVGGA